MRKVGKKCSFGAEINMDTNAVRIICGNLHLGASKGGV